MIRPTSWSGYLWRSYGRMLYPLADREGHWGISARLAKFADRERLSLEQNLELQWQAVLRVLKHAYETTPFYARAFDEASLLPSKDFGPADLRKLPPLTRTDLRDHFEQLWSRKFSIDELRSSATGGTTDTPVAFRRDRTSIREKIAVQLRFNHWAGFEPGDKVMLLWGAQSDFPQKPSWIWQVRQRYGFRRCWMPTSTLNEQVLEFWRQSLNEFRPQIIYAYPTPLAIFCEYLAQCGRDYHLPVSVICTAEPLYDRQRRAIKDVLQCDVFEHYGSRDFGMVGGECEMHNGLHLNPHSAYVELLPVPGAQVEDLHEILVTDLLNYGMPLIRYRINDCAVLSTEKCACGRGYPLIKRIAGRTTDVFRLANGDLVPGVALTNRVLKVCRGLEKIQVVQEMLDEFRVRYVPGPGFSPIDLDHLRVNLRKFFPPEIRWKFDRVQEIERERSGKTRFAISRIGAAGMAELKTPAQK